MPDALTYFRKFVLVSEGICSWIVATNRLDSGGMFSGGLRSKSIQSEVLMENLHNKANPDDSIEVDVSIEAVNGSVQFKQSNNWALTGIISENFILSTHALTTSANQDVSRSTKIEHMAGQGILRPLEPVQMVELALPSAPANRH
jgi:hypothetical protein